MTRFESTATTRGAIIVGSLVVALLILHQDNWFWNDDTLVLGFMPIGLFYHAMISVAASVTWWIATRIAWPIDQDEVRRPESLATDRVTADADPNAETL